MNDMRYYIRRYVFTIAFVELVGIFAVLALR